MKKLIFLFIAISLSSFTTIQAQKQNTIDLICSGKWYVDYAMVDGIKRELPKERAEKTWLLFYRDGKHDAMSPDGLHKGTWKLNEKENSITFTENSKYTNDKDSVITQKIISISATALVFETSVQGQKFTIHFKKK
jgi:hypothetical protein